MKHLAALVLALAGPAHAQVWHQEPAGDAAPLMLVVCLGLAFFWVRGRYARSPAAGHAALAVCVVVALAAAALPPVRWALALLTAAFLIYGFSART